MDFLEDVYDSEMISDMYAVESADIRLSKELLKLHTMDRLYEIDCMEKDMQFAMEAADDDTYIEYFSEASKEIDAKKENVLKRAWDALRALVDKIKEVFRKMTRKKANPNANIPVPISKVPLIANIKKEWAKAKPVFLSAKDNIKKHKGAVGFIALLTAAGITGKVVKNYGKKSVVKGKQLNEALETADDIVNTMDKVSKRSYHISAVSPDVQAENIKIMQQTLRTTQAMANQLETILNDGTGHAINDGISYVAHALNVQDQMNQQAALANQMAMQSHAMGVNAHMMGMGMGPIM